MSSIRFAMPVISIVMLATCGRPTLGGFHVWKVQEVFTNADGSVQFIEMFDPNPGEHFVANQELRATSDGVTKIFTFPSNLPTNVQTTGRTMLIATPGFSALAGSVTPDFTLPDPATSGPFFNPAATSITINFAFLDSITFVGASLPRNGTSSIVDVNPAGVTTLVAAPNSPTHFPLATPVSGSINVPPSGDYNKNGKVDAADYVLWRKTRTQNIITGQGADGNVSGVIDDADYAHWRARFGNSAVVVPPFAGAGSGGSMIPEPTGGMLVLWTSGAFIIAKCARRRRSR